MAFLVSRMPTCFRCHVARDREQIPSNHWFANSCFSARATEEIKSQCFPSNSAMNRISTQQRRASVSVIEVRCGEGNAMECVFKHCCGLMRCQDETVSTLARHLDGAESFALFFARGIPEGTHVVVKSSAHAHGEQESTCQASLLVEGPP